MVVRVRNRTNRTYYLVQAGDPFYKPRIGDTPADNQFEVPPGFDEAAEDLVIPWAATSGAGLLIGEVSSSDVVRCVVGPSERDGYNMDWLRMHDDDWEPVAQDRWLALGKRHFIGVIGGTVNIELSFRERRLASFRTVEDQGKCTDAAQVSTEAIAQAMSFESEAMCAPANTVFLNVFDLVSVASIPNAMLCNTLVKSFGAFHAAVEVYGDEWSFYRQAHPDECGICRSHEARRHPVHVYRQSINLGETRLKDFEVWNIIRREVAPKWPSCRYDIIHCNCIHFCDELLMALGVSPAPAWVRGLHETGAALLRPLSLFNGFSLGSTTSAAASSESLAEFATPRCHHDACDEASIPVPVENSSSAWSEFRFTWPAFSWNSAGNEGQSAATMDSNEAFEDVDIVSSSGDAEVTKGHFLDTGPVGGLHRSESFLSAIST